MAITFDEKPDHQFKQMLEETGSRWEPQEKAWEPKMNADRKRASDLDAKRAFYRVANAIRAQRGL